MSAKTVFISYRRDPVGKLFSRSLKTALEHHGPWRRKEELEDAEGTIP
jgi:hypothetical protein